MESAQMETRPKSTSLDLVLVETESEKSGQQPLPLQTQFPLRRSPRFTPSHNVPSLNPKTHHSRLKLLLQSSSSYLPHFERADSSRKVSNKSARDVSHCSSARNVSSSKSKSQSQSLSLTMKEGKRLRRSPRLVSAGGVRESNGLKTINISEPELYRGMALSFPNSDSLGDAEKQLSNIEGCCGLRDSLEDQPCKRIMTLSRNADLVMDDEFLKQFPNVNISVVEVENGETKPLLIEFPETHECHSRKKHNNRWAKQLSRKKIGKRVCFLTGDPVPNDEALERWRWRYEMKHQRSNSRRLILDDDDEDKIVWDVEYHYIQANINGTIFNLGDCANIEGDGGLMHVGKIIEFFKTTDGEDYFRVQWFYRAEDTVIKQEAGSHEKKRLFYSTVMNDNPIDCIISKVRVIKKSPQIGSKPLIRSSDFYFDMEYHVDYSSFQTMEIDESFKRDGSSLLNATESVSSTTINSLSENILKCGSYKAELALLDLFSGCGGMSSGLCLGAKISGVDLVTRWALDSDKSACESLKLNHPETNVRNEAAEDFLELLKEWEKLCKRHVLKGTESRHQPVSMMSMVAEESDDSLSDNDVAPGEYEVSRLVGICYGDPDDTGKRGLYFKVHWKGYSTSEDTWEPTEGLRNCQECIRDFVRNGFKSKILPLPGDVDVICGGPPCQGISGYNRFRNVDSPLSDERNRQITVFMDIVQFLKPRFVLMENVSDILKFDKASFARYALSRLVHMKYQARLGTMAAGCYGLPQFRLRVFLWGAHPSEKLPQFPLPTHDVIVRYWPPSEFERNTVAYSEGQPRQLEKALVLQDAISDLPAVTAHDTREEMTYGRPPFSEFQRFIRSTEYEMTGSSLRSIARLDSVLYDHRPYALTEEDYARVCLIPKRKGANFRDLPGIVIGNDNVVRRDPTKKQVLLPSGKPLVPDFAFTFEQGKSKRPYARLWWDETVPTVVTYPSIHSQAMLHPEQDRVLTIRECARLQGFPDYYRFSGTIKERYRQVGNAVSVPVSRALGYALGMAFRKLGSNEPLMTLPPKFSHSTYLQLAESLSQKTD